MQGAQCICTADCHFISQVPSLRLADVAGLGMPYPCPQRKEASEESRCENPQLFDRISTYGVDAFTGTPRASPLSGSQIESKALGVPG